MICRVCPKYARGLNILDATFGDLIKYVQCVYRCSLRAMLSAFEMLRADGTHINAAKTSLHKSNNYPALAKFEYI